MPRSGFTGISYPFRMNGVGGVAISTTSIDDPTHIAESIIQCLSTGYLERPMEGDKFYSNVDKFTFEVTEDYQLELLKNQIVEDIRRLEPRVSVSSSDVVVEKEVDAGGICTLYAYVTFKVLKYETSYTAKIRVGGSVV